MSVATDPGVLAVLGLVLVLLWQEIAEVGLPGGISIKRRLEQQKEATEQQARRADQLDRQIIALQLEMQAVASARAQASSTTEVYFSLDGIVKSADEKLARFYVEEEKRQPTTEEQVAKEAESADKGPADGRRRVQRRPPRRLIGKLAADLGTKSEPVKQAELLRAAARLERWATLAEDWIQHQAIGAPLAPETASLALGLSADKLDDLIRWKTIFADELTGVFAARNSLVHAIPLTSEDLDNALHAAARLIVIPDEEFEPFVESAR